MSWIQNQTIIKPITMFDSVNVSQRTPIIELKSTYGLSVLRDRQVVSGSGTVTNNTIEYNLSTSTTTASSAILESAERGRYLPGSMAQAGIGVRTSGTFTGTSYARWGYFDDNNGFGFGVDVTGTYVFTRRAAVDTKVYQSSWNTDKLNGTGSSALTLALIEGNIFQIDFSWYGYGAIEFKIVLADANFKQQVITVHRFSPSQQTSVENPNLPIRAEANNGNTTTDYDVFIGGRQFSVYEPFNPNTRVNSHRRDSLTSIGTTFLPVISFKRKTAFVSVAAKMQGIDLEVSTDMYYQIRVNGALTGASYGTPADTTASETAMEVDTTASAIAGGELLYQGLISATGVGLSSVGSLLNSGLFVDIPAELPITLCVRTVTGSGASATGAVVRWTEEW